MSELTKPTSFSAYVAESQRIKAHTLLGDSKNESRRSCGFPPNAHKFVTKTTLQAVSGHPVRDNLDENAEASMYYTSLLNGPI